MDKRIVDILNKLQQDGNKAYVVGGYVRDYILGKYSKDVDICTSLLPNIVSQIFGFPAGILGNVSFKENELNIEITTYRLEYDYKNRRPQRIEFIEKLSDDLKRRDFTINTLCIDSKGNIVDLLNGKRDIDNKIIRSVGNNKEKLFEDPLRILRAIRLATVLDFQIEESLDRTIKENYKLVSTLSWQRIRAELDKILMSKNYLKGIHLLEKYGILELLNISYKKIVYVDNLMGMWAQFKFLDIPFTNNEKKSIINITEIVSAKIIDRYTLYKYGLDTVKVAGSILGISDYYIKNLYNNLPIKSIKDIDITSNELIELGIENRKISDIFALLENKILSDELLNTNIEIKKYLTER